MTNSTVTAEQLDAARDAARRCARLWQAAGMLPAVMKRAAPAKALESVATMAGRLAEAYREAAAVMPPRVVDHLHAAVAGQGKAVVETAHGKALNAVWRLLLEVDLGISQCCPVEALPSDADLGYTDPHTAEKMVQRLRECDADTLAEIMRRWRGVGLAGVDGLDNQIRQEWAAARAAAPGAVSESGRWKTLATAAEQLGVNRATVGRMADRRELIDNGARGKARRIDAVSLLKYCERHGIAFNER